MSSKQLFVKEGRKYVPAESYYSVNEEVVLFCAFRYALGRMTYVVGSVADAIRKAAPLLTKGQKLQYSQEIIEHYNRSGSIGMTTDTECWAKLACYLDEDNSFTFEANHYKTDIWVEATGFKYDGLLWSRESYKEYHTVRNLAGPREYTTKVFNTEDYTESIGYKQVVNIN